jgi:hypothetical protein
MTVSPFDISSGRYPISGSFAILLIIFVLALPGRAPGLVRPGNTVYGRAPSPVEEPLMGFATVLVSTSKACRNQPYINLENESQAGIKADKVKLED